MKGNEFEWWVAKGLSRWITGHNNAHEDLWSPGTDTTQLIRSVLSGGASRLTRTDASATAYPAAQVGDLAPNGMKGLLFRSQVAVECKHYRTEPDWGRCFSLRWEVAGWWRRIESAAQKHALIPWLVMRKNHRPIVVGMPSKFLHGHYHAHLILPHLDVGFVEWPIVYQSAPSYWGIHV